MDDAQITRRDFLADSGRTVTAGWLGIQLPFLGALASCGREDARKGVPFSGLTPAEARAMSAFAAQIIPADRDSPGADTVNAVHFVDRAFGIPFFADSVNVIRAGLADLDARARVIDARAEFSSLGHLEQTTILKDIELTTFFRTARTLILIGTFAEPSHGGNSRGAGWSMIGIDHRPIYNAPFGWYDAQAGASSTTSAS